MKTKVTFLGLLVFWGLMIPGFAISKVQLDRVKARAAADNKLIAFVVMQECTNPGCPIAVNRVSDRNGSVKQAVPNKGVIVVKLDVEDLEKDSVPECVRKNKSAPAITITDATCAKVIDSIGPGADKARITEMESKIAAATGTR